MSIEKQDFLEETEIRSDRSSATTKNSMARSATFQKVARRLIIGRDPEDTRPVEFRVYDRQQAEFLRDFMMKAAPQVSVTLEQVDLELDTFQPRKTGRPKKKLTAAEATAKKEREKRQAADRQRKRRERLRADRGLDHPANDEGSLPGIDPSPVLAPSAGPSATPPSI